LVAARGFQKPAAGDPQRKVGGQGSKQAATDEPAREPHSDAMEDGHEVGTMEVQIRDEQFDAMEGWRV
jgi:hypothetical protein